MAVKRISSILIVTSLLLIVPTTLAQSNNIRVTLWTFSNGGGQSSNSQFSLVGTSGQFNADRSPVSDGRFTVTGGFWPASLLGATGGPSIIHLPLIARFDPPTPTPAPLALWQRIGGNGLSIAALAVQAGQLFVGTRDTPNGGLFKKSLTPCNATQPLQRTNEVKGTTVLGIVFKDAEGILAGYGDNLFYSNNSGQTWTQTGKQIDHPRAVAIAGNHAFFAGAEDGGIYHSVNGGVDWALLRGTSQSINQLRLDSLDTNSLWIANDKGGVSKLTVDAERLVQINEGLSGKNQEEVWDFAFDSAHIYIATSDGIFFRGDRNTPWQRFGDSLTGKIAYSLEIVGNQLLYAGTSKEGVWRRPLNGSRDWEQVSSAGWNNQTTVNDLFYDAQNCQGLLAATSDGVWLYR